MLRLGIDPEKLYRATFICQDGLCCCNMALISFRLFRKNLGNLPGFFGQMVYRPPWQKISHTPRQCHSLYVAKFYIRILFPLCSPWVFFTLLCTVHISFFCPPYELKHIDLGVQHGSVWNLVPSTLSLSLR